jgi:hypothetical protein
MKGLVALAVGMLVLLAAAGAAAALSLGSVQDRSYAEIGKPGEAAFRLLLFNIDGPGTVWVTLEEEHPFGLAVDVSPDRLSLPHLPPGQGAGEPGYEVLATSQGNVMVKPVVVRVYSGNDTLPGEYAIRVTASTGRAGGTLGVSQSRAFQFLVRVRASDAAEGEPAAEEQPPADTQPPGQEPYAAPGEGAASGDAPGGSPESALTKGADEISRVAERITGSIVSNPVIAPVAIALVLLAAIYLRRTDRI